MAIECLCGLINSDKALIVEPFVAIDAVEILGRQIEYNQDETKNVNDLEVSHCTITLSYLTDYSPEARRRILRVGRKVPKLMNLMKYHNRSLNIDLLRQWTHFENLFSIDKKDDKNKLPIISKSPKSIIKLPKINV